MPYRKLPKTDAARLKALKTLLDNNDVYTVRNRFIDWKSLNKAQPAYDKLYTACEQYKICQNAQVRNAAKIAKYQHNAAMYVSHFLQVLYLAVERGEVKKQYLLLYGLDTDVTALPNLKTTENILKWGKKVVDGEKARLKKGGRPIYNPSISMVATHYDIFKDVFCSQKRLQERTAKALNDMQNVRPEVDEVLLELWDQIEKHFETESPEVRFAECRKFGIIYYYRRHEEHLY